MLYYTIAQGKIQAGFWICSAVRYMALFAIWVFHGREKHGKINGMVILQKDSSIIVCVKDPGVLSTDEPGGLPSLVREALGDAAAAVYPVHRLDRVVGGLTLLARSRETASALGKQLMSGGFEKQYLAVVRGALPAPAGTFTDLLIRDKARKMTLAVKEPQKGAAEAVLHYSSPARSGDLSLVRVTLETGRTHQIRVQFASRGLPIVGDRKYGPAAEAEENCPGIALWSARLAFSHPETGKRISVSCPPPFVWPWTLFPDGALSVSEDAAPPARTSSHAAATGTAGNASPMPEGRKDTAPGKASSGKEKPAAPDPWAHTPCPLAKKCGGCQYQHIPYARQLELKEAKVRRLLAKYCKVEPIVPMASPFHYRGKVQAAFGLDSRGKILSGVYQSSSHRIVPVSDCMIEDRTADRIITEIRKMLPSLRIPVYDQRRGTGWLRHVLVKRSFTTGEVMVVLVAANPIFPAKKRFLSALLEAFPEIVTVVLNVNDRYTSLVLGERETVLYGDGYIEDELCGCRFRVSPRSFYQVNPAQTETLYRTAIDFAGLTGSERVLDAYCGTGTIGIAASAFAAQVTGVELNRDAVHDAIANAKRNGVKNCWFTCADAGQFMEQAAAEGEKCDVVFMDPPRAGSDRRFLSSLLRLSPSQIVYVSCNPETLARDLDILVRGGYSAERARCVDMFPFTEHIETVVQLSQQKPDTLYHSRS